MRRTNGDRFGADDEAIAGVVGFVLLLAVIVTYFAFVVHNDVPRWGADGERAWDGNVGRAMGQLVVDADNARGTSATVAGLVPQPPTPRSFEVPLVGRTQPVPPSGTLTFAPAGTCGGVAVVQKVANASDRAHNASGGCLRFNASPVYSTPFGYAYENGGLLRVQGNDSLVLRGPQLTIRPFLDQDGAPVRFDVALELEELRGAPFSASVQQGDVHVGLTGGRAESTRVTSNNSHGLEITFATSHVRAWTAWADGQLAAWRVNEPTFCPTGSCARTVANETAGTVTIVIDGPRVGDTVHDLSFAPREARFAVAMR